MLSLAPPAGLEPATSWLTVMRSANWAIEEYIRIIRFPSDYSFRQLSTFPGSLPPSIIDVKELNFCVRHGNRWSLLAIVTGYSLFIEVIPSKLNNTISDLSLLSSLFLNLRSSPRTISIGQLNTLLHLHLRPINHVVFMGPYQPALWEILSRRRLHA